MSLETPDAAVGWSRANNLHPFANYAAIANFNKASIMCGRAAKDAGTASHYYRLKGFDVGQRRAQLLFRCLATRILCGSTAYTLPNTRRFDARQHATVKPCGTGAGKGNGSVQVSKDPF